MAGKAQPDYPYGDIECCYCGATASLDYPSDKGILLWVVDSYTVHGVLDFRRCLACKRRSYCVRLDIIHNPDVQDELTHEYFWSNRPRQRGTTVSIMMPHWTIRGLPEKWPVYRTKTRDGIIERHFFGPFPLGRNEWYLSRSMKGPWAHAMWIIWRVVRQLTRTRLKGLA